MAKHRRKALTGLKPSAARGKSMERGGLGPGGNPNLGDPDKTKLLKSGTIELPAGSIPRPSGGKSAAFDFSQALMQGNPIATEALNQALHGDTILGSSHRAVGRYLDRPKAETEASLADEFVASTYTLGKAMGGTAHQAKQLEPALAAYRADMKAAHRFVLDDDFVRYATEVSSTLSPEKMLTRLQYATLPYQVTWIEYNLPVKVRTMRAIHQMDDSTFNYNSVGRRLGYLLHRLNDTDAVCQVICQTLDDRDITAAMCSYYFSLTEHEWGPRDGERMAGTVPMGLQFLSQDWDPSWLANAGITKDSFLKMKTDQNLQRIGRASMWGYSTAGQAGMLERVADLQRLGLPSFLERHGELGYSRLHQSIARLFNDRKELESISGMMGREITEFAGTMRWVAVVLAMLNEVPLDTRHVEPSGHVRIGLTGKRRMMDYHRLTLRLPKTKPLQYIERKFRQSTRRRAHEVMQHWRTYVHEVHCRSDEHDWIYDYDEGYRLCGKCEAFGRLIREHVRGDPSLGWVKKDYLIKKDKQT